MNDDDLAQLAFMRLQRRYADIATRFAWADITEISTPDAVFSFDLHGQFFELNGPEAYVEFATKMTGQFSFYEYIPLNFVATVGADGIARGHAYNLEVAESAETGEWTEFFGVYRDEYRQHEGSWRFARRAYQTYGRRVGGRLESFPLPDLS